MVATGIRLIRMCKMCQDVLRVVSGAKVNHHIPLSDILGTNYINRKRQRNVVQGHTLEAAKYSHYSTRYHLRGLLDPLRQLVSALPLLL